MILQSLAGLPAFLVYFCTALVAVVAYLFVYTRITPHDEFQLIRDNDPAAAIALGLSLLGFVLPVVSAIAHSANVLDCLIWSAIALIVQIVVYFIVKIPVPNLSARIAAGELAAAIWLGLVLAGRRRAQRRLHDLLTMDQTNRNKEFGKRKPVVGAGRVAAGAAGEALRPCRAAADGHARGRRRRLCADAARQLRADRRTWRRRRSRKRNADCPPRGSSSGGHGGSGGCSSRSSFSQRQFLVEPFVVGTHPIPARAA